MRKLILHCKLSPGDVLTLSAAVHSLHEAYPNTYLTDVRTTCKEIWEHNPHITPLDNGEDVFCEYPTINRSNQVNTPFLAGYTLHLGEKLGIPLQLSTNRPHLYLSAEEKGWMDQVHETVGRKVPFWLVNAGVKPDYSAKRWGRENYQAVVDALRGRVQFVQIGAKEHEHKPLAGVINLIGKTNHRQLIRLAYHCDGAVGPATYLMHLSAAWQKPYMLILGGREPVPWNTYPKQTVFHTIGALPCCRDGACWKSRVVKRNDGEKHDQSLCEHPILGMEEPIAKCMSLIRPQEVVAAIERYLLK